MRIPSKNNNQTRRIRVLFLTSILVFFSFFLSFSAARADMVTDYIGVQVGYSGMPLEDYVVVGDYHISEIMASLPVYEAEYSFFSAKADPAQYEYVVDSARGFSVRSLLDLAKVNFDNIYNLQFYVMDNNAIWSSFDRDELFRGDRCYFRNLPSHRKILYGTYKDKDGKEQTDYSRILGYNFDEAWSDCVPVSPMLAVEDNWKSYNEEFQSAGPDFSNMNTGTRFRLLYGQLDPTSDDMQRSAKYVRWVYVTLYGKPQVGITPGAVDGTYGNHTLDATLSGLDSSLNLPEEIANLLHIRSSNEQAMVVNNVQVEQDPNYSDLLRLKINYDVVGEGDFSFVSDVGTGEELHEVISETVKAQDPNKKDDEPVKKEQKKKEEKESKNKSESGKDSAKEKENGASKGNEDGDGNQMKDGEKGKKAVKKGKDGTEAEEIEVLEAAPKVYQLSAGMQGLLDGLRAEPAPAASKEAVTEVKKSNVTEEDKERHQQMMLFTGLGCLCVCGLGAAAEGIAFRVRLKRTMRRS